MHLKVNLLLIASFIIFILFIAKPSFADSNISYEEYMDDWNKNISLAKKYLNDTQIALDQEDTLVACSSQRKASEYGIKATKSRIKADKLKGFLEEIPNLEDGLARWEAFGNFCG